MEYYSKILHISVLKNYIYNDPIIDWFNIQNLKDIKYPKDKNNHFKKYITNWSLSYKDNFKNRLIEKIKSINNEILIIKNPSEDEAIDFIKKNAPILINPILTNHKYNLNVEIDLMIKKDLFIKIFSEIENINIKNLDDNYLIINIIPENVSFHSDSKTLHKNEILDFNDCSLFVFNDALKRFINRNNLGFYLAKGYKYRGDFLRKKNYIGLVKFNDEIKNKIKLSLDWIKRLKSHNYNIIENVPNTIELYPNMNFKMTEYEGEKKKLAERIKEMTLVWRITYKDRCELIKKGINTWDNLYLLKNLYDMKDSFTRDIQEQMIHMSKNDEIIISPRILSNLFQNVLLPSKNEYICDIESLLKLEETENYFDDFRNTDNDPNICIIGSLHLQNNKIISYSDFTLNDLSLNEEKNIIFNWLKSLKPNNNGFIKLYSWGYAENNYINYMKTKYPDIVWPKIIILDILEFFRKEPIILKDCFNFSLKTIAKKMKEYNFIKTGWEETDDALDAMVRFKQILNYNMGKNVPIKRYVEIGEIVNYNKVDCVVLAEIIQFLREKYLK